jgi:hypothetical protein
MLLGAWEFLEIFMRYNFWELFMSHLAHGWLTFEEVRGEALKRSEGDLEN